MKTSPFAAIALAFAFAAAVCGPAAFAQGAPLPKVDAEVRAVDTTGKTVTLKHGDITNVGMPAMTMTFRVKDAALLDNVKAGDKVRFSADKVDGTITVVAIDRAEP